MDDCHWYVENVFVNCGYYKITESPDKIMIDIRETRPADLPSLTEIFFKIVRSGQSYPHDDATTADEIAAYWLPPNAVLDTYFMHKFL